MPWLAFCWVEKKTDDGEARLLLRETADSWQDEYAQTITDQDSRELLTNVCAFFNLLNIWSTEESTAPPAPQAGGAVHPETKAASGLVITHISPRRKKQ